MWYFIFLVAAVSALFIVEADDMSMLEIITLYVTNIKLNVDASFESLVITCWMLT